MKTLIIYATKYGTTEKCVNLLKEKLTGDVTLVNIMKADVPNLSTFDAVVMGGSIYMGQIQKKLKNYAITHQDELSCKKSGLFICAGSNEQFKAYILQSFPASLMKETTVLSYFGGEFLKEKMNFFHKFIMGMVQKSEAKSNTVKPPVIILPENIQAFADAMNKLSA